MKSHSVTDDQFWKPGIPPRVRVRPLNANTPTIGGGYARRLHLRAVRVIALLRRAEHPPRPGDLPPSMRQSGASHVGPLECLAIQSSRSGVNRGFSQVKGPELLAAPAPGCRALVWFEAIRS